MKIVKRDPLETLHFNLYSFYRNQSPKRAAAAHELDRQRCTGFTAHLRILISDFSMDTSQPYRMIISSFRIQFFHRFWIFSYFFLIKDLNLNSKIVI